MAALCVLNVSVLEMIRLRAGLGGREEGESQRDKYGAFL